MRFRLPFCFFLLAFIAGQQVSCTRMWTGNQIAATLDNVESYINDRPDSALAVLRSVDTTALRGPGQRARAALLHQIALDKCYIDISSDSVLSPAFWYLRHGTADQKLKTWYYRSVLARNAGDIDTQMSCLVRGEQYIPRAGDPLMAGRLHTSKRVIFLSIFDVTDAVQSGEKAVASFLQAGDQSRYHDALIGLANLYSIQERYVECGRLLDSLTSCWETLSVRQQKLANRIKFDMLVETGPVIQLNRFFEQYLQETAGHQIDWVLVARAYSSMGEAERAEEALSHVDKESLSEHGLFTFLKVRADVLRTLGRVTEALAVSAEYRKILDELTERGLLSRARFLEEENRLRRARASGIWWIVAVSLLALSIATLAWFFAKAWRRQKTKASSLQRQLIRASGRISSLERRAKEAEKEACKLEVLLRQEQLPDDVSRLVAERVALLNRYALARITKKDERQAMKELEAALSRERREQFLHDLTLQFWYLHPGLGRFLGQYRLTEQEKDSCTLLAMGCKVKEISSLTGLSEQRCYNIFNTVRRKLRLKPGDGNLQGLLLTHIED